MTLFLAILLNAFGDDDDEEEDSAGGDAPEVDDKGWPVTAKPAEESTDAPAVEATEPGTAHAKLNPHVYPLEGRACGCLTPTNPVRIALAKVASHHWFERTTLLFIIASSAVLAIDGVLYWAVSCFNYGDDPAFNRQRYVVFFCGKNMASFWPFGSAPRTLF